MRSQVSPRPVLLLEPNSVKACDPTGICLRDTGYKVMMSWTNANDRVGPCKRANYRAARIFQLLSTAMLRYGADTDPVAKIQPLYVNRSDDNTDTNPHMYWRNGLRKTWI